MMQHGGKIGLTCFQHRTHTKNEWRIIIFHLVAAHSKETNWWYLFHFPIMNIFQFHFLLSSSSMSQCAFSSQIDCKFHRRMTFYFRKTWKCIQWCNINEQERLVCHAHAYGTGMAHQHGSDMLNNSKQLYVNFYTMTFVRRRYYELAHAYGPHKTYHCHDHMLTLAGWMCSYGWAELSIAYESDWSRCVCVCARKERFSKPRCHCFMRHHKYFISQPSICFCICSHWNCTHSLTWAIDFQSCYYFIIVLLAMSAATIPAPSLPPFISIVLWIFAQHLIFNLIRFERLLSVCCVFVYFSFTLLLHISSF